MSSLMASMIRPLIGIKEIDKQYILLQITQAKFFIHRLHHKASICYIIEHTPLHLRAFTFYIIEHSPSTSWSIHLLHHRAFTYIIKHPSSTSLSIHLLRHEISTFYVMKHPPSTSWNINLLRHEVFLCFYDALGGGTTRGRDPHFILDFPHSWSD